MVKSAFYFVKQLYIVTCCTSDCLQYTNSRQIPFYGAMFCDVLKSLSKMGYTCIITNRTAVLKSMHLFVYIDIYNALFAT